MTREDYTQELLHLSDSNKYLMLHLPTGFGKSRIAIEIAKRHYGNGLKEYNMLIVVPKLVLMDNWREELGKWLLPPTIKVTFTTYISYPKHTEHAWDMIVFDEAHHFTEACEEATLAMHYDRVLAMSATIPREPKWRLKCAFNGIYEYQVTARTAIEEEILPDPKVILIPMMLDNTKVNQTYVLRKSKPGQPVVLPFHQRSQRFNYPMRRVHIMCTEQQYYNMSCMDIEYKKEEYFKSQQQFRKNQWLQACKQRLDWMTTLKEGFVKDLLLLLGNYRTLTFCTFIEQTERLGKHPINSKDKKASMKNLEDFNAGRIRHITSASILNEGMNLVNCQIGIYANIGASHVVECQRLGRILRHKNPIIIIPFYAGTREEEIVTEMLANYNPELVVKMFKSQVTKDSLDAIIDGKAGIQQNND